jgi:hypothetical protein
MAQCPFARWQPVDYNGGEYTGGEFRIVHHTTEGSSATGALEEFKKHFAPHFVVDAKTIYQLLDTSVAGAALEHHGDPQTNRLSAVQIEVVGFAGKPKDPATLANVGKLCRWIEQIHNVPRVWPNGFPVPAVNGQDAGHHNRNPIIWAAHGGHYGHEHVPENFHWDPAYTKDEVDFLMRDAAAPISPAKAASRGAGRAKKR